MLANYGAIFWDLIRTPFHHSDLIWGIVPLYFGWLVNELTTSKASFKTAIQTGFSFLWAGAHWTYQSYGPLRLEALKLNFSALMAVNVMVTLLVLVTGAVALVSGLRHRYPRYCSFLGHTRFSNYFMIAIFPIQSQYLHWSWHRLIAIVLFAIPTWVVVHLGIKLVRRGE